MKDLARILFGLAISLAGGYFLRLEMVPPSHASTTHIYVFAGMIGFGCLLVDPGYVVGALTSLGAAVGQYLPWANKKASS